jgi:hypothetical protein
MNEAAKQVAKGHGAEDSSGGKETWSSSSKLVTALHWKFKCSELKERKFGNSLDYGS